MKRNDNFVINDIAGNIVLVPCGNMALDFNGIITLNETGKLLWENMEQETDIESLAQVLVDKYNINIDLAINDVTNFVLSLKEDGCIDE